MQSAATPTTKPRRRGQTEPAPDSLLLGLTDITRALGEIIGHRPDRATTARWLATGVRGRRIAGRRIGHRWACTRRALINWARETGALGGEG